MLAWQIRAVRNKRREAEAKREAQQCARFNDILNGAIVGAPADPEALG
jgi:hypothetical protein